MGHRGTAVGSGCVNPPPDPAKPSNLRRCSTSSTGAEQMGQITHLSCVWRTGRERWWSTVYTGLRSQIGNNTAVYNVIGGG
jgi:hypothetical protein